MPECLCQFLLIILFFKRLKGCKYVSLMNGLRITKFSCLCYSSLLCIPEIGLGLIGFGVLFSLLGIIMLFDKGFLAMGNILFVSGALLTIGPKPTVQFFTKPKKHKGSLSFGFGFFLILIGWPVLGIMLESYCFITLFSGFWPTAAAYLQKSPSVGWIFHHPLVTSLITLFRGRRVPV